MAYRRGSCRGEETKCHSYTEEGQEGGSWEPQASHPHFSHWKGGGATNPGNYVQIYKEQEDNFQSST